MKEQVLKAVNALGDGDRLLCEFAGHAFDFLKDAGEPYYVVGNGISGEEKGSDAVKLPF